MAKELVIPAERIERAILVIREQRVMLDRIGFLPSDDESPRSRIADQANKRRKHKDAKA